MKRYAIEARRDATEEWTAWNETDDIGEIEHYLAMVRDAGFEARVMDYKIRNWEQKRKAGNLMYCPVAIGNTVYAVIGTCDKFVVRDWVVTDLSYDGKKWYAMGDDGWCAVVGSEGCIKSQIHARKLAKQYTEDMICLD